MKSKVVSVIGLGYIGLPTAAVFASRKIEVIGVDINKDCVDIINRGMVHIVEPDLDMIVHAAVNEGYLRATTKPEAADAFLIAVPTPFKNSGSGMHEPDLSYVKAAAHSIAPVIKCGNVVILESTSPVGTTEMMAELLADLRPDLTFPQTHGEESDIRVAHCPERVLPGQVLKELVNNDRVIGGMTKRCSAEAVAIYKSFVKGECVITSVRTAEMCKLAENSFRDVNIAFANEMSTICAEHGIDAWELIRLANRHPRVNILNPGPGVGGHCIAVDPWFIVSASPKYSKLIRAAREVNDNKPAWVIKKVDQLLSSYLEHNPVLSIENLTIACLGISFKPDIDDLRESPALTIVNELNSRNLCKLLIVEPNIEELPVTLTDSARLCSLKEALEKSEIVLGLVPHAEFKAVRETLKELEFFIDVCGILQ